MKCKVRVKECGVLLLLAATLATRGTIVAQTTKPAPVDMQPQQITVATETRAQEPNWALQDRIAWGANLLLALAGYAGIAIAISLLKKIERQTHACEVAADAAADAARAALAETQAARAADRPWVLISTEPSRVVENAFAVVATNRGRTPARLVASEDGARIAASEGALPPEPEYRKPQPGQVFEPIVLLPGESVALQTFGRDDVKRICVEDGSLERVDTWEEKIYLYGRIAYRELRTSQDRNEFETRWCCWFIHGRQRSGLVLAGPASYQSHS